MPTIIEINCNDQVLVAAKMPVLASGGVDENKIIFKFSSEWLSFDKKVIFYNTPDEIYTVNIDKNGEAYIPSMVTAKPGKIYISVYGESDNSIRTSDTFEYVVKQGAITDSADPLEPIKEEAYKEGYVDGYENGSFLEKQITEYVESIDNQGRFNSFLNYIADASHTMILPYFKTDKILFNANAGSINPSGIKEVGFDVAGGTFWTSGVIGGNIFKNTVEKLIITGFKEMLSNETAPHQVNSTFANFINLRELYIDTFASHPYSRSMRAIFSKCGKLRIIGGYDKENRRIDNENFGEIDFTGATSTDGMFGECHLLEEMRWKKHSLAVNVDVINSPMLSRATVLSMTNGLKLDVGKAITLAPSLKILMDTQYFCYWDSGKEEWIDCRKEDIGAVPYSQAVADSGWVLK